MQLSSMQLKPGMWTEAAVADLPCDVYEPTERNPHNFVLIYLHGVHLQRLIHQPKYTEQFEMHGLPVVAPMTQRSWWTDRICPEFHPTLTAEQHVLKNVVPFIEAQWGAVPPKIALFGTSMGGQGALRLSYKHPNTFPIVAAVSPAIDFHLRIDEGDEVLQLMYSDPEAARQETAILYVHPLNWPRNQFICCDPTDRWWDSLDRLRMKLSALGIPFEQDLETSGGGHGFTYYNLMAPKVIDFLVTSLHRERLRLPV